MQSKGNKFEWKDECATIFEQLKQLLKNNTLLKILDSDKEFVVCKDACKRGLGEALMQEGHVVCYESWKLNEHEKNYLTHDLELRVMIHALKMWRHYLLGMRFVLMSDHIGLRYLFDQSNMNVRKDRWLSMINEFDFEIRYIKGKENRVTYALSRRIYVNHITAMNSHGTVS